MKYIVSILILISSFASAQVIQLIDSKTKENVNFERVAQIPSGFTNDGIMYAKKGNDSYKRVVSGAISVKWFGAKGDGINDDTSAIQRALNYVYTQKLQKVSLFSVYVPSGNYKITSSLKVPTSIKFYGDGVGSVLHMVNDFNLLELKENLSGVNERIEGQYTVIRDLKLQGQNFALTPGTHKDYLIKNSNGILIDKVLKVNLENLDISGFNNSGIYYNDTYYQKITNVFSYNNRFGLFAGNTTTSIQAVQSEFRDNSIGIYLSSSYANFFTNCLIERNFNSYGDVFDDNLVQAQDSKGLAVFLKGSFNNSFVSNYIEGHLITFYMVGSNKNVISNNFISVGYPDVIPPDYLQSYLGWLTLGSSSNIFSNNNYLTNEPFKSMHMLTDSSSNLNLFQLNKNDYTKFTSQNGHLGASAFETTAFIKLD